MSRILIFGWAGLLSLSWIGGTSHAVGSSVSSTLLTATPPEASTPAPDPTPEDGQIVRFQTPQTPASAAEALNVPERNVEELLPSVYYVPQPVTTDSPAVASIEPNSAFRSLLRSNDPSFGNQVGMSNIAITDAWDHETGHGSVKIAVVDTGINGLHQELFGRVIEGWDYVNNRAIARNSDSDDNGHGTAVASVAAAAGNNGLGMAGISWAAEIIPFKALNSFGIGYTREVMLSVRDAIERKADILLLSIGAEEGSPALLDSINAAWDAGILVVAAAGNDGPANLVFPARYDRSLSVGATDGSDVRAGFSNVGLALDLVAPGVDILHATDSDAGYALGSGTSLSAPLVAGTAALILARHPGTTNEQLFNALRDHADRVAGMGGATRHDFYGYGRLNAARAVAAVTGQYAAEVVSTGAVPPLGTTQSWQLEVQYRNTGTSIWRNSGPYRTELATAEATDRLMPFLREDLVARRPSGWLAATRMQLVESEVRPGGVGTFRFYISVPQGMTPGAYRESVQPFIHDVGPIGSAVAMFDIRVLAEAERYHAAYVGQTGNPTLAPGGSAKFQIFFRNTGNATWTRGIVQLAASHDRDRVSRFLRQDTTGGNPSGWRSPSRINLDQETVAPGEIGSFTFYLADTADIPAGTYREHFQPVADGITWMEDGGLFWDVTVQ